MKKSVIIIAALCAAVGCNKSELNPESAKYVDFTLTGEITPIEDETKLALGSEGNTYWNLVWAKGDAVGVWSIADNYSSDGIQLGDNPSCTFCGAYTVTSYNGGTKTLAGRIPVDLASRTYAVVVYPYENVLTKCDTTLLAKNSKVVAPIKVVIPDEQDGTGFRYLIGYAKSTSKSFKFYYAASLYKMTLAAEDKITKIEVVNTTSEEKHQYVAGTINMDVQLEAPAIARANSGAYGGDKKKVTVRKADDSVLSGDIYIAVKAANAPKPKFTFYYTDGGVTKTKSYQITKTDNVGQGKLINIGNISIPKASE